MNIGYFIVIFFFAFVFQLPAFLTVVLVYPIKLCTGRFVKFDHTKLTNYFIKIGLRLTNKVFFKTKYVIDPSVDLSKRQIYMMNHQTYTDPIVGSILNKKTIIPVVGYLPYVPVIGYNAVFSGAPVVKYGDKKDKSVSITKQMTDLLKNDPSAVLTMFPEGKRTFSDDILLDDIRTGGFVVAKELNLDIVPIYHNTIDRIDDVKMEYNTVRNVYCLWGKPIESQGKEIDQLKQEYFASMKALREECIRLKSKSTYVS